MTRVLVIEDNWECLELMRVLLKFQGIQVAVATDGMAGLETALREFPDLVLCDILMPGMDGFEVLRRMRAEPGMQEAPVVAVTALDNPGDRDRILAAGFDGYLPKPISPETFAQEALGFLPARSRSRPQPPKRETTILVVDDLQSNLELAEIALGHLGYRVILAHGMDEGLRGLRQAMPDVVMSDVRMDDGDGFEFVAQVRSDPVLRSVPFILITSASRSEESRTRGLALGADRFLFRPIAPHVLRDEIEACVRERRMV